MRIGVTSQDLKSASVKVSDIANQYQNAYRAIIQAADDISSQWQGEDFTEFQNQVHALEDDFKQLYDLLVGCSNDLNESADGYIEKQTDNVNRARGLATTF